MTIQLERWINTVTRKKNIIDGLPKWYYWGQLTRARGMVLEAVGLQLPIGSTCFIERYTEKGIDKIECEVIGFKNRQLFLMPLENNIEGIPPGARVYATSSVEEKISARLLPLGPALLGRVLDGNGLPLDNLEPLKTNFRASLYTSPLNPLSRSTINEVLDVGVRAINGLLTVGRGQRMGLFAGSGVGKSMLLGMMARYTKADVIIVGLIGERGREVKDFVENNIGKDGIDRAVIIACPADVSPMLRIQGATYATRIAEDFRNRGKHVLLIMDSLTRYAMAQREIGLAVGEPPATKGYPPSVFAKLSSLIERAGNSRDGYGSITAFYTILMEGDDQQDPIADAARAILDGHIVLSRKLAESGHYPAIDIEASISRVMTTLVDRSYLQQIQQIKQWLASYQRNRDLLLIGAYSTGSDPVLDQAIKLYPQLESYLRQDVSQHCDYVNSCQELTNLFNFKSTTIN